MHRNVRWIPLIVIIVILFSGILLLFFNIQNSKKLPCDYLDSINITDGTLRSDLSITFNDITYTNDQHFEISYVLKNGEKLPTLQPYRRGCICRLKPCVRLCCAAGTFFDDEINKCQNQTHPQAKLFEHDVLNEFNETEKWILDHHFAYVYDRPCQKRFIVDDNYSIINVMTLKIVCCFMFFHLQLFDLFLIFRQAKFCMKTCIDRITNIVWHQFWIQQSAYLLA